MAQGFPSPRRESRPLRQGFKPLTRGALLRSLRVLQTHPVVFECKEIDHVKGGGKPVLVDKSARGVAAVRDLIDYQRGLDYRLTDPGHHASTTQLERPITIWTYPHGRQEPAARHREDPEGEIWRTFATLQPRGTPCYRCCEHATRRSDWFAFYRDVHRQLDRESCLRREARRGVWHNSRQTVLLG